MWLIKNGSRPKTLRAKTHRGKYWGNLHDTRFGIDSLTIIPKTQTTNEKNR